MDESAKALNVGLGGILSGLLSGLGVFYDLRCVKEVFAPADIGAKGVQVPGGNEVADGAVAHAEDAGGIGGG